MGTFKNPDVWKQNLAYQIGDFVLYNGTVYMAIKPVPAGTEMSADYWTEFAEGAIVPTGEISITENGEVNVAQYATANVNVEGGGGGSATTDVWLWNGETGDYSELIPSAVKYLSDFDGTTEVYSQLSFEHVTETLQGATIHGIRVKDVPVGAWITLDSDMALTFSIYYSQSAFPPQRIGVVETLLCPMPIDGFAIVGLYRLDM